MNQAGFCKTMAGVGGVAVLLASLLVAPASAQEPGAVQAFRQLRSEGMAAANADDLTTAAAKFVEAAALIPNHPGLTLLQARVALAAGDQAGATAFWDRYARMGLNGAPAENSVYAELAATPGFAATAERLARNRQPVGAFETVVTIDRPVIAESVAWDGARSRYLISTIGARTILQADSAGAVSEFMAPGQETAGILGLALDAQRGVVWAASSGIAMAQNLPDLLKDRTELIKIDLTNGRILARYAPEGGDRRNFGDVAMGPDGTVYVSDSIFGDVYRLRPGADALELLVPAGRFGSPQGMAVTPDGAALVIADYSSGLHRIDLATGVVTAIRGTDADTLLAIDMLQRSGDCLIVVQNGVSPQRVLRLHMDAGFSAVTGVEVLAANLDGIDEPAGGTLKGDDLVFVARGQMASYEEDGSLKDGAPPPALIGLIDLD